MDSGGVVRCQQPVATSSFERAKPDNRKATNKRNANLFLTLDHTQGLILKVTKREKIIKTCLQMEILMQDRRSSVMADDKEKKEEQKQQTCQCGCDCC